MRKLTRGGVYTFALASVLIFSRPCRAQDGPIFPGFESADSLTEPKLGGDRNGGGDPVKEPLPIDHSITPLDERGQPMLGPETELPPVPPVAPSRVNRPRHLSPDESLPVPSVPPAVEDQRNHPAEESLQPEPPKRNLWQRSTDALRDLTQPKAKSSQTEPDAGRHWQTLRQREMQQMQLQQRQMQQRQQELLRRQAEQMQLQQRQSQQRNATPTQQGWDPRLRTQRVQPQIPRAQSQPGLPPRGQASKAAPQASSRRQPQRYSAPRSGNDASGRVVPPVPQGQRRPQPREANNEPRSPWERY